MRHSGSRAQGHRCNVHSVLLVAIVGICIDFITIGIRWVVVASWASYALAGKFRSDLNIGRFVAREGRFTREVVESTELFSLLEDFSTGHDINCESGDNADPTDGEEAQHHP